ncbi:MAG TPA: hypothetical protein VGQ28_07335 [Thermoanaerobaculia bacterium]|jgi:hypothetical protein|nr:hypothetical protein [Thermoanaerobaculia bacterium]
MKTSQTIFLALILGLGCLGGACTGNRTAAPRTSRVEPRTALEVLRLRQPNTEWNSKTLLQGDLDQNGGLDYAATGLRKDRVVVGIVEGPISARSRTWFLDFPWKGGGEGALCSEKAKMTLEPLDSAAKAGERKVANKPGVGLNLHDDRCDAFHIYWDPERKTFDWWRL